MATVDEIRQTQRAGGTATVLAIGTANPPNCVYQSTYPDFLFRVTNSEHKTELKEKFQRICDRTKIKKRYMHLTEDILKKNPSFCEFRAPTLDAKMEIIIVEIPKLAEEAATKAIKEWGQPKSKITHLIFCTSAGVDMPGADYQLTNLLGLSPDVKRYMMYQQGSYAGAMGLRLAKDLTENNKDSRVLLVCAEMGILGFSGLSDTHLDGLVGHALFGDGAAAAIIGSDPLPKVENPLFELVWTAQTILPDSGRYIKCDIREVGMILYLNQDIPNLVSKHIEKALVKAFQSLNISDYNSIFWILHSGGRASLDKIEAKLGLKSEKLQASKDVLSEYGNMLSASVLFVMDEMRRKSKDEGHITTGEGLEWGVLLGLGPGITIDTVLVRSVAI